MLRNKKFYFENSIGNYLASAVFLVFTFYSILGNTKPFIMGTIAALLLITMSAAINGVLVGGISSIISMVLAIYYKINIVAAPTYKVTEKQIEKLGESAAIAASEAKKAAYSAHLDALSKNVFWYILAGLALAFLARYIFLKFADNRPAPKKSTTKNMAYRAMFITISVVLNTLRVGPVSFGGFPIIYSGLVLGPVSGFVVGVISDWLGFIIRPSGQAFNILFTLTSGLTGAIPALIMLMFKKKENAYNNFFYCLLAIAMGQVITSVLMVPLFMKILYGTPFLYQVIKALSKQVWSIPLYAFIFTNTYSVIVKQINFKSENNLKVRLYE